VRLLCTFPGRYGDLLWQLPLLRALAHRIGEPVSLQIAGEFKSIAGLIAAQSYIRAVISDQNWSIEQREAPPTDGIRFDRVIHLGYRGWPEPDLVQHTLDTFNAWSTIEGSIWSRLGVLTKADLNLDVPWIEAPPLTDAPELVIAFSETHFELKLGLIHLVLSRLKQRRGYPATDTLCPPGSRWATEAGLHWMVEGDWSGYATSLAGATVALCCNSGAHVLAVAMGVPVVMMEPMEARWNPIFFPVGDAGPQVTLVRGTDGRPTTDCRHVADALAAARSRTT
jgi:hypothetical protein